MTGTEIARIRAMTLADIIVIYFACGSPFAVHQLTRDQAIESKALFLYAALSFAFWPFFAGRYLYDLTAPANGRRANAPQSHIEGFRVDLENAGIANGNVTALFEFRDIFYRYTGLHETFYQHGRTYQTHPIFELTDHPAKKTASRCLARRNKQRLDYHLTRSRNEFIDLTHKLNILDPNRVIIVHKMLSLAKYMGDTEAAVELKSMISTMTFSSSTLSGATTSEEHKAVAHRIA